MSQIKDLVKDRDVYYVQADKSVMEVARYMVERNIGAVPVVRDGELVGIFSERDIMKRVLVGGVDPRQTMVSEVMTANPYTVPLDTDLEQCLRLMRDHNFRHLPICDGKKLLGLVSLRDVLHQEVIEKDGEVNMMRAYISGGADA
jgi:CBS domain-containing protein